VRAISTSEAALAKHGLAVSFHVLIESNARTSLGQHHFKRNKCQTASLDSADSCWIAHANEMAAIRGRIWLLSASHQPTIGGRS